MQIIIYNKNGGVFKSLDCEEVQPLCGAYKSIVIKKDYDDIIAVVERCNAILDYMYTNLPFVAVGDDQYEQRASPLEDNKRVILFNDSGGMIRMWENVSGLCFLRDIISFNSDNEWYSVNGNVTITPM
jgi:hypothetical protein